MPATLYTLAVAALLSGDPSLDSRETPRKPNPFAPSLNELTDAEEPTQA